jgi:hypothetical protein
MLLTVNRPENPDTILLTKGDDGVYGSPISSQIMEEQFAAFRPLQDGTKAALVINKQDKRNPKYKHKYRAFCNCLAGGRYVYITNFKYKNVQNPTPLNADEVIVCSITPEGYNRFWVLLKRWVKKCSAHNQ